MTDRNERPVLNDSLGDRPETTSNPHPRKESTLMSHPVASQQQPIYAPAPPTNTMAVLSLVFAFLFWPLGIAFGHTARKQIARTGESGRGLATAGLVISYVGLGFLMLLLLIFGVVIGGSNTTSVGPAVTATPPVSGSTGPVTTFGDGTRVIGTDIEPGTYKTSGPASSAFPVCTWQRLRDTSGELNAVIASDISRGPATVTINKSDGAFASTGCNTWTKVG